MPLKKRLKTPLLLQMEAVECGAAALGIVLSYYDRFVPLAELRRECGVSRDGSKASNVVMAARRYGLKAKGYSKESLAIKEMGLPLIIFWKFNHFLVVEGFGRDVVYLNDPAYGHVQVSWDEFDTHFTGVVLAMEPGPDFRRGGSRPSMIAALWQRLGNNLDAVLFCFLAGLFLVLPNLAVAAFTGIFLDDILTEMRFSWLRPLIVAMAATVLLQFGLKLLQLHFLRRLELALATRMTSRFFWHLLRLPMSFYAQRFPGEISSRTTINDKVADTLSGKLATTSIDVCTMIFYAVVLFYFDALLTAIGVSFAAFNFVALRWLARRRVEANMRLAQEGGKVAATAIASLHNIESVKASGTEAARFVIWAGRYARASNARLELERSSVALGSLPTFLQTLTTTLILVVGGLRVIAGEISIGMLVAFQALMSRFLEPVANLVDLGKTLQDLQGDLMRLDDVLTNPTADNGRRTEGAASPTPAQSANDGSAEVAESGISSEPSARRARGAALSGGNGHAPRLRGELEIRGLTFGYSPLGAALVQDFSIHIRPGERVALVGASGSGKSTLAKLLSGLYEPWQGDILFDGKPRIEIPGPVLCNSVGIVDQDIMLFEGSVRDNLSLWDPTIPEAVLERACKDASIHEEVMALPGGYDSILPEGGVSLSGGQRQRLEIARALVNNPSVLILDEATSALDSETERIISENLRLRGCTCVMVAHRLSTIRDCDEIIVLERGKVVERGNHERLWDAGGHYAKLIRHEEQ